MISKTPASAGFRLYKPGSAAGGIQSIRYRIMNMVQYSLAHVFFEPGNVEEGFEESRCRYLTSVSRKVDENPGLSVCIYWYDYVQSS